MFDWMQQSEENVAQIFPDWLQQSEENCGHLDCPGSMPGNRGLYTLFSSDPVCDFRSRITKSNYIYYNIKFSYVNINRKEIKSEGQNEGQCEGQSEGQCEGQYDGQNVG